MPARLIAARSPADTTLDVRPLRLQSANAHRRRLGQQVQRVADASRSAPNRSRDHGPLTGRRKRAVDRQSETSIGGGRVWRCESRIDQRLAKLGNALSV